MVIVTGRGRRGERDTAQENPWDFPPRSDWGQWQPPQHTPALTPLLHLADLAAAMLASLGLPNKLSTHPVHTLALSPLPGMLISRRSKGVLPTSRSLLILFKIANHALCLIVSFRCISPSSFLCIVFLLLIASLTTWMEFCVKVPGLHPSSSISTNIINSVQSPSIKTHCCAPDTCNEAGPQRHSSELTQIQVGSDAMSQHWEWPSKGRWDPGAPQSHSWALEFAWSWRWPSSPLLPSTDPLMNPATICAGLSLPGPGDSSVCLFGTTTAEVPSPPLTGPLYPSSYSFPPVLLRAMAKKQLWPSQLKRCPQHPSPHSTWPHMHTRPFLTWLPPSPPLLLTLLTLDNTKSFLVISGIIQAPHALQLFNLFSNMYLASYPITPPGSPEKLLLFLLVSIQMLSLWAPFPTCENLGSPFGSHTGSFVSNETHFNSITSSLFGSLSAS